MVKKKEGKKAKPKKNRDKKEIISQASGFKITNHDIPYLETDIDKLFKWVKERKSIPVLEAAKKFGVSTKRIKEWGKILEEHKLLQLHYPIFGEPVLRVKPPKDKKKPKKEEAKKQEEKQGEVKEEDKKSKRRFRLRISKKLVVVAFLVGFFAWFLIYGFFIDTTFFLKFGFFFTNSVIPNSFLIIIIIIIIVVIAVSVILHRRKKRQKKGKK